MNTNEETRLRNLLLKESDGIKLRPLDVLYLKKLSAKKAAEQKLSKQNGQSPAKALSNSRQLSDGTMVRDFT